jgi:SAM-dependent methyltransferase
MEFVYGDFYEFDFPAEYDFFLAQYLLHHLADDEQLASALKRLNRTLGASGKFVVVEMVMPRSMEFMQNALRPLVNSLLRLLKKPELRFFSEASLCRLLGSAGFDRLAVHHIDIVGWTAPAPALFPKLKIPGWLFPLKCVVVEASSGPGET